MLIEYISVGEHPNIAELLPLLLIRPEQLTDDKMLGIVLFSYILGGASWISASKLLSEMKKEHQDKFFTDFKFHLTNRFGNVIADWSC